MEQNTNTSAPVASMIEKSKKKWKWSKNCYGNCVRRSGLWYQL